MKILTPTEEANIRKYSPAQLRDLHQDISLIIYDMIVDEGGDVSTEGLYEDPITLEGVKEIYDHGSFA